MAAASLLSLSACSPELDWREFQPEGSGIVASFPCRPDRHVRSIALAGRTLKLQMLVCDAAGANFVLLHADLDDPAAVTPVLEALHAAAVANIGARTVESRPLSVPGMTPNPQALGVRLDGRRPDGVVVQQQAAFFVRGLRVYQASVVAEKLPPQAGERFVAALRFPA